MVESERGRKLSAPVAARTSFKLEDALPGTPADFRGSEEVGIGFDPDSRVAFDIDTEEQEAEIKSSSLPSTLRKASVIP